MPSRPEINIPMRLSFQWESWMLERDTNANNPHSHGPRWKPVLRFADPRRPRKIAKLLGPDVLAAFDRTMLDFAEWARAEATRTEEAAKDTAASSAKSLLEAERRARQAAEDLKVLGIAPVAS